LLQSQIESTDAIKKQAEKQRDEINRDALKLVLQQAQSRDPNVKASLQVQINEKTQELTKLRSDTDAKIADKNQHMKLDALKATVQLGEVNKEMENKSAQISKTSSFVTNNQAAGTVNLYHRGRKTTVHVRKASVRRPAVKRAVAKRRPAAKRVAKRVVHRKKSVKKR
jgi:hypothetical protein